MAAGNSCNQELQTRIKKHDIGEQIKYYKINYSRSNYKNIYVGLSRLYNVAVDTKIYMCMQKQVI